MNHSIALRTRAATCVAVASLVWLTGVMGNVGWAQDPRPTLTPVPTATSTPEPSPTAVPTAQPETEAPTVYAGPLLSGRVINLSTGEPVGNATVIFDTGEVAVEVVTDENGAYAFPHLGAANGLLNVVAQPGSGLRPATADVAVRTKGGVETVVNLGLVSGGNTTPLLMPTVEVSPGSAGTGGLITVTVFLRNTLPQTISGTTVTSWLPQSLEPVRIQSSTGNPYFSDNLAVAELGTLDVQSGALVEIVARVTGSPVSAAALRSRVSLFYRENVAAQAASLARTDGASPTVLPTTGGGGPFIALALLVVVILAGWARRRIGRRPSTA